MKRNLEEREPVVVAGSGRLACSISVCLLQAGHEVTLLTDAITDNEQLLATHFQDIHLETNTAVDVSKFSVRKSVVDPQNIQLVIAVTNEKLDEKKRAIQRLEALFSSTATLAINAECIPLDQLQEGARYPERLVVANWVEPAHTTFFLELISNEITQKDLVENLYQRAKEFWKKDPYWLQHGSGIRHKMMSALVREAFYLVENGYATVEDIDRACRNDAGYYLSFAGNCRYMDLMGTYAYGMVMKDLNKELCNDSTLVPFFTQILDKGKNGMQTKAGFYEYEEGEVRTHEETIRKFSYQIQQIIENYPFNYKEEELPLGNPNL